jgi:hypothetical protein
VKRERLTSLSPKYRGSSSAVPRGMHLSRAVLLTGRDVRGCLERGVCGAKATYVARMRGNYTEVSGTRLLYVSVCGCANSVFFFFSQKIVERTVGDIRSVRTCLSVDTQVISPEARVPALSLFVRKGDSWMCT